MFRLNGRSLAVVAVIILIFLSISGCADRGWEEGIVAKVDGEAITQEEFNEDLETTKKVRQKQYGEDILSQDVGDNKTYEDVLREDILEKLILEKLMAKELDEMNIKITDEDVDNAIKIHYIEELGGEEQYREYLENNGFTEEFFKRELKKALVYEKHREDFFSKTNLTEEEIKKYFEENKDSFIKVRASHILVKTEEEGKDILQRLKNGEKFHELVATESADSDSAVQGGDLGYFTKGTSLPGYKELEDAAFSLEIGETSELVKSELGYHIILLEDKKDSYEDLKEDIIPVFKNSKYIEKIAKLREEADVKIYLDNH